MSMRDPYQTIKTRHVTEKSALMGELQNRTSNKSLARCKSPKAVFIVDMQATKADVKAAVQQLYKDVKVTAVNTIRVKGKAKKRGRGRLGATAAFKKAIVTFAAGDVLEGGS